MSIPVPSLGELILSLRHAKKFCTYGLNLPFVSLSNKEYMYFYSHEHGTLVHPRVKPQH